MAVENPDLTVDWLVVGTGAAGMTGAVVAHESGGSVLVVEKEAVYGGTTAKSGGVAWIPGNHSQAEVGIRDSAEEGYAYLKGLIGNSVSDARIRAYATRASEMLAFMMKHSHVAYSALPKYMDYYEHLPGYKSGGRSMDNAPIDLRKLGADAATIRLGHYDGLLLPFNVTVEEGQSLQEMNAAAYLTGLRLLLCYLLDIPARLKRQRDNRLTLGPALVARLRLSLQERNIPLWLNSPVRELLLNDGRVCGALVEHEGKMQRIHARRGVLLATGGFSHNAAMRQQYQRAPIGSEWTAAAPGATGDAVTMGTQIGAALGFMDCAWWSPTYTIPDGRVMALIAGKSNPGSIMVNRLGKRFANEAQPYEDLVKAQYDSDTRGEGAIPCYLVFDATYRGKYAVGHLKPGKVEQDAKLSPDIFESGLLTKADTLETLAGKLQIDPGALVETVESFNRHARKGEDPEFGRGETEHDRYYADKKVSPNPSLGPLETAPFYALRCDPGDLDTKGGLLCDEYARVLNASGDVIEGLYAAGNASAAVMGNTYPGAGSTIGSAMTFAYIAARHAFDISEEQEPA
ncbi:3-oxosteroid 1-dehydrogenase [Halioglobus japonicus]|nr:3-oxosteroid 1-dehydrogenase [Halioglobus japonicus]